MENCVKLSPPFSFSTNEASCIEQRAVFILFPFLTTASWCPTTFCLLDWHYPSITFRTTGGISRWERSAVTSTIGLTDELDEHPQGMPAYHCILNEKCLIAKLLQNQPPFALLQVFKLYDSRSYV